MKHKKRQGVRHGVPIADMIEGHSTDQRMMGSYAVDGLLHLAMPTVPALHGIRGRRKNGIIEEAQRLLEVWAEKLLQGFGQLLGFPDSPAELAELGQGRLRAATAVEQAVRFIHDLAKCS